MKTLTQTVDIKDAVSYLDRAVALLKKAGEPLAAMRVAAVAGGLHKGAK